MNITYHLSSAQEISTEFLDSVKATFKSKAITITIEEEFDTTEYLNSNKENKNKILKSLEEAKKGKFIEVDASEL